MHPLNLSDYLTGLGSVCEVIKSSTKPVNRRTARHSLASVKQVFLLSSLQLSGRIKIMTNDHPRMILIIVSQTIAMLCTLHDYDNESE